MAFYFRQLPNLKYSNLNSDSSNSDYVELKNLFRRGRIRSDILNNLAFFTKYAVIEGERPDVVAYKFYEDESLDWIILLCNDILDVENQWPMPQSTFNQFLLQKYQTYENIYAIHHYETQEILDSQKQTVIKSGMIVNSDFQITYYDNNLQIYVTRGQNEMITTPITNYNYELKIENQKRNIYILKPEYLNVIFNDMESIMTYKNNYDERVKYAENSKLLSI